MAATNLPAERTSFGGSWSELEAVRARFEEDVPLLTIVGAAGVGKTRLALRCA